MLYYEVFCCCTHTCTSYNGVVNDNKSYSFACRDKIVGPLEGLVTIYHEVVSGQSDYKLSNDDALQLIEALRFVIHPEAINDAFQKIWPILNGLFSQFAYELGI